MARVVKIVLTGGPCGGKTSAMPVLKQMLQDKGWKVYTTPEVATLASDHGVNLGDPGSPDKFFAFINLMMALEGTMETWAKDTGRDCIILSDRGLMDAKAYTPDDLWPQYLATYNLNEPNMREGRYDAVFHLVSAANGAPDSYNHDNPARWENLEQAIVSDRRTQDSWVGHPHFRIIDNSTDFPTKIQRLCSAVEHYLDPNRKEIERRFLIEQDGLWDLNKELIKPVTLDVSQIYLKTTDGTVARVRCRGDANGAVYTYTVKSPKTGASCMEVEHNISSAEFAALAKQYDPDRKTIQKKRHCFLWHGKQFELDEFVSPHSGMRILEIELDREDEEFVFPAFLTNVREITTDPLYSNWNLAYGRNDTVEAHQ